MLFRPCIDLHSGKVKQIVGSTLETGELKENFVAEKSPGWFAGLFRDRQLSGAHVIMLGPGNEAAAIEALSAYPGGMSVGGGINASNAKRFLDAGAYAVIITSAIFENSRLSFEKVRELSSAVGRDKLILDLSCVSAEDGCRIACDRWRTVTNDVLTPELLCELSPYCCEFLVHAVSSEGKRAGADSAVVDILAAYASLPGSLPVTYAGGLASMADAESFIARTEGRVYFTVGSALNIYGGDLSLESLATL